MTGYRKLFVILALGHSTLMAVHSNGQQPDSMSIPAAEELNQVIVPITKLTNFRPELKMGLKGRFGPGLEDRPAFASGFCLDEVCRFIATNYHVARIDSPKKIKGKRVVHRYLATGPTDHDATINLERDHGLVVPYAVSHDLALFELRYPVGKHHGLKYSASEPEAGQEVEACGYPLDFNPLRHLVCVSARFKAPTTSGLLAFEFDTTDHARGGMSGGIIVDRKEGRIVAVVQSANEGMVLGVSVQELIAFVSKVEPFVASRTFPAFRNINPISSDLYSKYEPMPDTKPKFEPTHSGILEHRPTEPSDVARLRQEAQKLADNMRNFIAVEKYWWGKGNDEPQFQAEYEVRVVDGEQRFRAYPDGRKQLTEVAEPRVNTWVTTANEWAELPEMVGSEYKLKIRRVEDADMEGKPIKVFQYRASVEDNLCPLRSITDYGLFRRHRDFKPGCYGEAWLDADWHIVRISVNEEEPDHKRGFDGWVDNRTVITYGPTRIDDQHTEWTPLTIYRQAVTGKKLYWCRGTFSNYRLFGSTSRLLATWDVSDTTQPTN